MAKYEASPQYTVGSIIFDVFGRYETDDAKEIEALNMLTPTWVKRVDAPEETKKPEEKTEVPEAPVKPAAKPKATKSSAK